MKRLALLLLLLPSLCFADTIQQMQMSVLKMYAVAGGSPPAPTYLASESFDTAPGYDLTWTEAAGTPDEDYATAPAPLEGTQSLYLGGCANSTAQQTYTAFTATGTVQHEAYFLVRFLTLPSTNSSRIIATLRNGTSPRATLLVYTASGVNYLAITSSGGSQQYAAQSITTGTTYHVWITHAVVQVANDAVATVGFSTTGTRPGAGDYFAQSTNGTAVNSPNRLYLDAEYSSATNCTDQIVDKARVDDTTIGNNPS